MDEHIKNILTDRYVLLCMDREKKHFEKNTNV